MYRTADRRGMDYKSGRPIRVAQILNRMDSGGIEAVVLNYFRYIDRDQFHFDFFCDENSSLPCREEMVAGGAGIFLMPQYMHPVRYVRTLQKALQDGHYDIAHVHMNAMSVFALYAAWRAGIPVRICHNHTTASWSEGARTLLKILLRPWNLIFATDFFACGRQAAEWMYGRKRVADGKVQILPNAINSEAYAFDSDARFRIRQELGIDENALVVGHIGRFMKQKNHEFLIQVFSLLRKAVPGAVLLLIGEGNLEAEIRERTEQLGIRDRVIFAGVRDDVGRVYSAMDVFCLPSFYEGFPVVLLEAQANGLPVVCSARISAEVCLSDSVLQLPLDKPDRWVSALLSAGRTTGRIPACFELRSAVRTLEAAYRHLSKK